MPPAAWEPVVTLRHGELELAVCRDPDDGMHWLTSRLVDDRPDAWGGGPAIDRDRLTCAFFDDWTEIGGLAEDDVHRVEVAGPDGRWREATLANGAWVGVLDGEVWASDALVRFSDAAGELVPGRASERMRGAGPAPAVTSPCPVCKAVTWIKGDEEGQLACARCGHEAGGGTSFTAHSIEFTEVDVARMETDALARARQALEAWRFPLTGLGETWIGTRLTSGHGSDFIQLEHDGPGGGYVAVTHTAPEASYDSPLAEARETLAGLLARVDPDPPEDTDPDERFVRIANGERERSRRAALASHEVGDLPLDDESLRADVVSAEGRWVAVAERADGVRIAVASNLPAGAFRLVTVADPLTYAATRPIMG